MGDAIKEGIHRGNAEAEHDVRSELGDEMTTGEKAPLWDARYPRTQGRIDKTNGTFATQFKSDDG